MEQPILFRVLIEVLGKPQEHVEKALRSLLAKLQEEKSYQVLSREYGEPKQQQDLWSQFVEVELRTTTLENLTAFCFNYMPSALEILEPVELRLKDEQLAHFLNDLQGRLHQVDMVAKQVKVENDWLKKNMSSLLTNYIIVLLGARGQLTSAQLSQLTGVDPDKLEDYLDHLIDDKKIDLKEGKYFLLQK